jgi:hypothetical protein
VDGGDGEGQEGPEEAHALGDHDVGGGGGCVDEIVGECSSGRENIPRVVGHHHRWHVNSSGPSSPCSVTPNPAMISCNPAIS